MENITINIFKCIFLKTNPVGKKREVEVFLKEAKQGNIEIKDDLFVRCVKFNGFCLLSGTVYGLIKSSIIYNSKKLKEIYVPSNIFEKYSLFYANKFVLNGNILFWGSKILNKIIF